MSIDGCSAADVFIYNADISRVIDLELEADERIYEAEIEAAI